MSSLLINVNYLQFFPKKIIIFFHLCYFKELKKHKKFIIFFKKIDCFLTLLKFVNYFYLELFLVHLFILLNFLLILAILKDFLILIFDHIKKNFLIQ